MIDKKLEGMTVIKFGEAIDKNLAEDLFKHITENLPGGVDKSYPDSQRLVIKGTIRTSGEPSEVEYDDFVSIPYREDKSKIIGIKFSVGFYDTLVKYRPEIIEFWRKVKTCIDEYFQIRKEDQMAEES